MPFQINFENRSNYIHATVTGANSRQVVMQYMNEVLQECIKQDCFRLLIEELLTGPRLDTMEVFAVVSEGSMKALGRFEAIAFVDEKMGDMIDFAETVAVNRGMPIAMFDNIEQAKEWLSRQEFGSLGEKIFCNGNGDDRP